MYHGKPECRPNGAENCRGQTGHVLLGAPMQAPAGDSSAPARHAKSPSVGAIARWDINIKNYFRLPLLSYRYIPFPSKTPEFISTLIYCVSEVFMSL